MENNIEPKKIIKIVKTPSMSQLPNLPPPQPNMPVKKVIIKKIIKMPPIPMKNMNNSSNELPFPPESPHISDRNSLSDLQKKLTRGLELDTKKLGNIQKLDTGFDLNAKLKMMGQKQENKKEEEEFDQKVTSEDDDVVYTLLEQVKAIVQENILNSQISSNHENQEVLKEILVGLDKDTNSRNDVLCKFIIFQHKGGDTKKIDDIETDLMKAIEMLNSKRKELKETNGQLKDFKKKNKKMEGEVKKLEGEVKLLQENGEDYTSQVELYKHQLDFLQKCHEEDQKSIQNLSEKLLSLPQKYESNGGDEQLVLLLNKTTTQLEESKNEIKKLNYSKQILNDKLFEQSNELEKLKKGNNTPTNQKGDSNPKLAEYQRIIIQLQNDKRSLEESVIELINQNSLISNKKNNNSESKLKLAQSMINELLRERSLVEDELMELYKVSKKK